MDIHGKITDLVNDKHPVLGQNLEFVWKPVFKMSLFQLLNELVAVDVVSGKSVPCGHKAQSGNQMGLAHAGRVKEYHIFPGNA